MKFDYTDVRVEWVDNQLALVFKDEGACLDFIKHHEGLEESEMFCYNGYMNAMWLPVWRNENE